MLTFSFCYFPEVASDIELIPKHGNRCEAFQDDLTVHENNIIHSQTPNTIGIDHNKLLLSIFSILQKLGADERPEVPSSPTPRVLSFSHFGVPAYSHTHTHPSSILLVFEVFDLLQMWSFSSLMSIWSGLGHFFNVVMIIYNVVCTRQIFYKIYDMRKFARLVYRDDSDKGRNSERSEFLACLISWNGNYWGLSDLWILM